MPTIKDITVRVVRKADGADYKEYAIMHRKGTDFVTCFIESSDGEEFDIVFEPKKNFPLAKYPTNEANYPPNTLPTGFASPWFFSAEVALDGLRSQLCQTCLIDPENPAGHMLVLDVPHLPVNGNEDMVVLRQWAFTDVKKTSAGLSSMLGDISISKDTVECTEPVDIESALAGTSIANKEETTLQGSITVKIFREVNVVGGECDPRSLARHYFKSQQDIDKLDPDVTHITSIAPPKDDPISVDLTEATETRCIEDNRHPFARFIFYYRSAEKLVQFGIKDAVQGGRGRSLSPSKFMKRSASCSNDEDTASSKRVTRFEYPPRTCASTPDFIDPSLPTGRVSIILPTDDIKDSTSAAEEAIVDDIF